MFAEQAYLFRHSLLRDAAYQLQLPGDRARLHALALDILELVLDESARAEAALELAGHAQCAAAEAGNATQRDALLQRELLHLGAAAHRAGARHRHFDETQICARIVLHPSANLAARCSARLQLATACKHLGRTRDALEAARVALAEAEQLGSARLAAQSFEAMAGAEETLGDYDSAKENLTRALERLGDSADARLICELRLAQVTVQHASGAHALAEELARESLASARALGARELEARSLQLLGAILFAVQRHDESIAASEAALALLEAAGDKAGQGVALTNMGACLHAKDEIARARDAYRRALALATASGSRRGQAVILNNLGTMCDDTELEEAVGHYLGAIEAAREVSDPRREIMALNGLSYTYKQMNNRQAALDCAEQSIKRGESSGRAELAALALLNRGHLHAWQGRFVEAKNDLLQALAVFERVRNWERILKCCINLNQVAAMQGDASEARAWKARAEHVALEHGMPITSKMSG